jgi:beta-lactamase regulating signal transducer with metallopeptidase domain
MIPLPANVVEALGWTLLHSLWQGASIAAALWTALLFLRKASPQARYLASCTALALMALCPIATFGVLYQPTPAEPTALITSEMRTIEIAASPEASDRPALPRDTLAPSTQVPTTPTTISPLGGVELQATLARSHPYLVSAWLIGVLLLAARLLAQYLYLHRLRRRATPAPAIWQHHLEVLAHRLDLKRTVTLLTSSPLDTPAVLGFLKPAVLLPASALTGLSREQLEAILTHELAHIRRYDALVNLIQTALETLLFYHPAAWWVSAQIRAEREHCCDDTAVALCGNPLAYAKALANLEGLRAAPKLAPAMSEGKLLRRIRRVVGLPVAGERPSSWVVGALLVGVLLFSGLALTLTPATASTKAPESDALHNHLAPAAAMPPDRHTIWTTVTEGVVFDEDLRILDPNGYLLLEERAGSTTRLLYVTRGDDPNDLVYKYVVNGEVQPFDNAARAWFATMRGDLAIFTRRSRRRSVSSQPSHRPSKHLHLLCPGRSRCQFHPPAEHHCLSGAG